MAQEKPSAVILSLPENDSVLTISNNVKEVDELPSSNPDKMTRLEKLQARMAPLLLYVVSTAQFLDVGKQLFFPPLALCSH
jgi:hypothetical protein